MRPFYHWLYPLFLGVVMFNILRAVTDLTKEGAFWVGPLDQHLVSQVIIIILCYIADFIWRRKLEKKKPTEDIKRLPLKEYALIFFRLFLSMNIILVIGEYVGVFYMGSGIIDYMLINVVFIPLQMIYYAIISAETTQKNYNKQIVLLEKVKNKQLATELELLKAQYHPHFLINALNTVYFQINDENTPAKHTIELLSELLRYQLYDIQQKVDLSQEIDYLKAYIELQQLRISDRLVIEYNFDFDHHGIKIHPLLFQPFLENAFKYVGGAYLINSSLRLEKNLIIFTVENSVPDIKIQSEKKKKGLGIENLNRRLTILYPDKHSLKVEQKENTFWAELIIEID